MIWLPEIGVGYYPVEANNAPYDIEYFRRFKAQADTDIGRALMRARVDFVRRHYGGELVDVGIGCGAFIDLWNMPHRAEALCLGYDVSPVGRGWLERRDLYIDPYDAPVRAVCMWDVMEHIHAFDELLSQVQEWLFLSLPIFTDCEHVLRSKHYRKDEHCWYFTRDGLVGVMSNLGFGLIEHNTIETDIGREDIGSFAFRRI